MSRLPKIPMVPSKVPQQRISEVVSLLPRPALFNFEVGYGNFAPDVVPKQGVPRSPELLVQVEWAQSPMNYGIEAFYLQACKKYWVSCGGALSTTTPSHGDGIGKLSGTVTGRTFSERALVNEGVNQAEVWLDRYAIEPTEDFTERIDAALREARLIIPILSQNWVSRPWCQKELERFGELKKQENDEGDFIVLVKKGEVPEQSIPALLRNREGYKFFIKEPGEDVRDFYWRGVEDETAYFDVLKRMVKWISGRMLANAQPVKPARATSGRSIYVAAPADELRDPWQRLVNDLRGAGYIVLPAEARLPDTAAKADEAIRAALGCSEISIHFLGETEGMKPDGSNEGIVRRQLRLAREHASDVATFQRILWAPKWLPEHKNTKRDPFEVVKRFGTVLAGEDVYAEEVTDLSQWVRGRLDRKTKPEMLQSEQLLLVAGASTDDDNLVTMLANRLQSDEIKVKALFAGDPMPASAAASAVLVPWGKADRASIDALLSSLSSCAPRLIVLRLPGGDESAKRRFFREGIYSELLDAVPPDRKAARELLVKVEIVQSDERPQK
jgi:hypothetical protein